MPIAAKPLLEVSTSPLLAVENTIAEIGLPHTHQLHRGKTYFEPCVSPTAWQGEEYGIAAQSHAPAAGLPRLREELAARLSARRKADIDSVNVVVTSGATHGIGIALQALVQPGDEVLILSPQWLFTEGLVRAAGAIPREAPVFLEMYGPDARPVDLANMLERHVGPHTRAIYFNNLNNPTGFRFDYDDLAEIADLAQRHDLWIISDNAYEDFDFSGDGYPEISDLDSAAGRTISVYTFSKTYSMSGYRVGYLTCPPSLGDVLEKWQLYSIDSVSNLAQYAALDALCIPASRIEERKRRAMKSRDLLVHDLKVPHTRPDGGLFTFLDLSRYSGGSTRFIADSVMAGVSLAPGQCFGGGRCSDFARLCFTAVPPDDLTAAISILNDVYAKGV